MRQDFLFTSESVAEGHPDKVCDRISDAVTDRFLAADPLARTAIETLATTRQVVLAGEVRSTLTLSKEELEATVRGVIRDIGYEQENFHWNTVNIHSYLHAQSQDIAQGVDASADNKGEGAGDQGIMFGYACRETDSLMPAPITYAHNILRALKTHRESDPSCGLGPDAKSQVTLEYRNRQPVRATRIVLSTQHNEGMSQKEVRDLVCTHIENVLPKGWMPPSDALYINPTGRFVIGGPDGDAGLTGRKIIVDTYGGSAPHGGGAFSGKDPTKVDRSAAYAARYIAKNLVALGCMSFCVLQLSYAIGVAEPLSLYIHSDVAPPLSEEKLLKAVREVMPLTPRGIVERLQLRRPIYSPSAAYGHFGRTPRSDGGFSWEALDLVDDLKAALSL